MSKITTSAEMFATSLSSELGLVPPPMSQEQALTQLQQRVNELSVQIEILKGEVKKKKDK